jgi:hypothetical protein
MVSSNKLMVPSSHGSGDPVEPATVAKVEEEDEEEFIQNRTRAEARFLTRWDQHAVAQWRVVDDRDPGTAHEPWQ